MKAPNDIVKMYADLRREFPMCAIYGKSFVVQICIMSAEDLYFAIQKRCTLMLVKSSGCITMEGFNDFCAAHGSHGLDIAVYIEGEWMFPRSHPWWGQKVTPVVKQRGL